MLAVSVMHGCLCQTYRHIVPTVPAGPRYARSRARHVVCFSSRVPFFERNVTHPFHERMGEMPDLRPLRSPRSWVRKVRAWSLSLVLLAALAAFVWAMPGDPPVYRWFFWRYPQYWLLGAFWATSCFCAGHAVL